MGVKTYSLTSAIEIFGNNEDSKRLFEESLLNFKCKFNSVELEDFLKNKAINFEERHLTRTYIAYDKNPLDIIGYYSIGIKSIDLHTATRRVKREIASDEKVFNYPAFLLAHIGECENSNLKKYSLLDDALSVIKSAQSLVGGRAVYLDCDKNKDKLFLYYYVKGFRLISENDDYKQMAMKL